MTVRYLSGSHTFGLAICRAYTNRLGWELRSVIAGLLTGPGFIIIMIIIRGVDPYGTGGTCPPNIYEGGHPW